MLNVMKFDVQFPLFEWKNGDEIGAQTINPFVRQQHTIDVVNEMTAKCTCFKKIFHQRMSWIIQVVHIRIRVHFHLTFRPHSQLIF